MKEILFIAGEYPTKANLNIIIIPMGVNPSCPKLQ